MYACRQENRKSQWIKQNSQRSVELINEVKLVLHTKLDEQQNGNDFFFFFE